MNGIWLFCRQRSRATGLARRNVIPKDQRRNAQMYSKCKLLGLGTMQPNAPNSPLFAFHFLQKKFLLFPLENVKIFEITFFILPISRLFFPQSFSFINILIFTYKLTEIQWFWREFTLLISVFKSEQTRNTTKQIQEFIWSHSVRQPNRASAILLEIHFWATCSSVYFTCCSFLSEWS